MGPAHSLARCRFASYLVTSFYPYIHAETDNSLKNIYKVFKGALNTVFKLPSLKHTLIFFFFGLLKILYAYEKFLKWF